MCQNHRLQSHALSLPGIKDLSCARTAVFVREAVREVAEHDKKIAFGVREFSAQPIVVERRVWCEEKIAILTRCFRFD